MIFVRLWYKESPQLEFHSGEDVLLKDASFLCGKEVSKESYCIGYLHNIHYKPHGKKIKHGYVCDECKRLNPFFYCAMCTGNCLTNNQVARDWCNQPFVVYLAYFGGEVVKVGVAAKKRLIERLTEQGAVAYKILDEVENGRIARIKEKNSIYPDKISLKDKINGYRNVKLDWFEAEGIIKCNLDNTAFVGNKKLINVTVIPNIELKLIGTLAVFENGIINLNSLRGKKLIHAYQNEWWR